MNTVHTSNIVLIPQVFRIYFYEVFFKNSSDKHFEIYSPLRMFDIYKMQTEIFEYGAINCR